MSDVYWVSRLGRLIEQNPEIDILKKLVDARHAYISEAERFQILDAKAIERVRLLAERDWVHHLPLSSLLASRPVIEGYRAAVSRLIDIILDTGIQNSDMEKLRLGICGSESLTRSVFYAIMTNWNDRIKEIIEQMGVEPEFAIFILETPLVPILQSLRKFMPLIPYLSRGYCPFCGRPSTMVAYAEKRKFMACTLCGGKALVDIFFCPGCEESNPGQVESLKLAGDDGLGIEYCLKCHNYVKSFDEDVLSIIEDWFLADIATLDLDALAEQKQLKSRCVTL